MVWMEVKDFKKEFLELQKKYTLPSFEDLDKLFDISLIDTFSSSLIRDIRKKIIDKVVGYVRLAELMLNPSQASPVFMVFLKEVNSEDKKLIDEIFKKFVPLEVEAFKLDVLFDESQEAKFIKDSYDVYDKISDVLLKTVCVMERNWNSSQIKEKKAYFGWFR